MNFVTKALAAGGGAVLFICVGVFAPAFLGFGSTQVETYSVKLVPQGTSGVLKVDEQNKCNKGKHDGCMLFEVNEIGLIKFYLPGSKKQLKNCTNADKVITKVEVTTTGAGGDPEADKGDYDRTNLLPLWVKTDAFTSVNRTTGVVYQAHKKNDAFTQVILVNLNSNKAADGEKSFWYRVTATDCETPANQWVSDPRGDNEGTRF